MRSTFQTELITFLYSFYNNSKQNRYTDLYIFFAFILSGKYFLLVSLFVMFVIMLRLILVKWMSGSALLLEVLTAKSLFILMGASRNHCAIYVSVKSFFFFIEEEETSFNFVCTSPFNYITLCSSWKRVVFFKVFV